MKQYATLFLMLIIATRILGANEFSYPFIHSNSNRKLANHAVSNEMPKADLRVKVACNYFRSSFTSKTYVEVENNGSETAILPVLSLFYPEGMYLTLADGLFSKTDGTYSIKIDSIKPGEHIYVELEDSIGPKLKVGEELSFLAAISNRQGELYAFDDEVSFNQ